MEHHAKETAKRLVSTLGLSSADLSTAQSLIDNNTVFRNASTEPFVPSPFRVTELIAAVNASVLALSNLISKERIGEYQMGEIDCDWVTGSLTSHFSYSVDDLPAFDTLVALATHLGFNDPLKLWKGIMNHTWRCKDGKYLIFFMRPADTPLKLCHAFGFSEKESKEMEAMLAIVPGRAEFARRTADKIGEWDSAELEARIIKLNATAAIVAKTREEFAASPHGQLAKTWPTIEIISSGVQQTWKPTPWTRLVDPTKGILSGVKVLELTRVLLGPRGGCLLAALGATVIRVNSPTIEEGLVAVDVNLGKLSFHLDMKSETDKAKFRELILDTDVLVSNNAFGVMDRLGFGFENVCKLLAKRTDRGIVFAQANAFGFSGDLASAGGYEHLGHAIIGVATTQGEYHAYSTPQSEKRPAAVPINVLDISTGHSLALGVIQALRQRAVHGGSYLVQTSLLQVGMLMQSMGLHSREIVERAWERYQPEFAEMDPERRFGGGAFGFFLGFQQEYFRKGYPDAFRKEYRLEIKDSPWFGPGQVLKLLRPALKLSKTPVRYRTSTRPVGWDTKMGRECRFPSDEELEDLVPVEGGAEGEVRFVLPKSVQARVSAVSSKL